MGRKKGSTQSVIRSQIQALERLVLSLKELEITEKTRSTANKKAESQQRKCTKVTGAIAGDTASNGIAAALQSLQQTMGISTSGSSMNPSSGGMNGVFQMQSFPVVNGDLQMVNPQVTSRMVPNVGPSVNPQLNSMNGYVNPMSVPGVLTSVPPPGKEVAGSSKDVGVHGVPRSKDTTSVDSGSGSLYGMGCDRHGKNVDKPSVVANANTGVAGSSGSTLKRPVDVPVDEATKKVRRVQ